jgi:hypothetical protein
VTGSDTGMIGVDFGIGPYNPCGDHRTDETWDQDWAYPSCATPHDVFNPTQPGFASYYTTARWRADGSDDWPLGIFINNQDDCHDVSGYWCDPETTPPYVHNWGKKVTEIALEVYPDDPQVGGVRLSQACCSHAANGGWYTTEGGVGDIALPNIADANAGKINGYVFSGNAIAEGRVKIDAFQTGDATAFTSQNIEMYGFSSTANHAEFTSGQAYWTTKAMFDGDYFIYFTDANHDTTRKVVLYIEDFSGDDNYLQIDLDEPCFGFAEPLSPAGDHAPLSPSECDALWS